MATDAAERKHQRQIVPYGTTNNPNSNNKMMASTMHPHSIIALLVLVVPAIGLSLYHLPSAVAFQYAQYPVISRSITTISPGARKASASSALSSLSALSSRLTRRHRRPPTPLRATAAATSDSTSSNDAKIANIASIAVETKQVVLGSGTHAEIMYCLPPKTTKTTNDFLSSLSKLFDTTNYTNDNTRKPSNPTYPKPILIFLHGSFHASWCWAEHYMPFFAELGYPCVALSWQGTGGTPAVPDTPTTADGATDGGKKVKKVKKVTKVKVESHVNDLNAFLMGLNDCLIDATDTEDNRGNTGNDGNLGLALGDNPQIVLLGHSFGGLYVMKWLEQYFGCSPNGTQNTQTTQTNAQTNENPNINLAGVALLCSVPPSGNGPVTLRYLRRSLVDTYKITVGFAMKRAIYEEDLCRDLFFRMNDKIEERIGNSKNDARVGKTNEDNEDEDGISSEDIQRYQSYFARDTIATIDLRDLNSKLPSLLVDKSLGCAPFAKPSSSIQSMPASLESLESLVLPPLVLGASSDFIVDREGIDETARYMGLELKEDSEDTEDATGGAVMVKIVKSPHDIMLGRNWRNGANAILDWVEGGDW